jgi:hypothetical protein
MTVSQMLCELFLILKVLRAVMTFEEAVDPMFEKLMFGPEAPSWKCDEQITTTVKGADVGLQVLEYMHSGSY